jgi:hypothetical protein
MTKITILALAGLLGASASAVAVTAPPVLTVKALQEGIWTVGISGTPTVRISNAISIDDARSIHRSSVQLPNSGSVNKSDVVFTVPTGKRAVITDVIANTSSATNRLSPRLTFTNECVIDANAEELVEWWVQPIQQESVFQLTEHLTTGIVLNAGDCLRVSMIAGQVFVLWYEESAN